jgi:hypothetical protein
VKPMSPNARALLDEVRGQSLPRARREALLRSVERRLALGEVAGGELTRPPRPGLSASTLEQSWRAGTLLKVALISLGIGLCASFIMLSPRRASRLPEPRPAIERPAVDAVGSPPAIAAPPSSPQVARSSPAAVLGRPATPRGPAHGSLKVAAAPTEPTATLPRLDHRPPLAAPPMSAETSPPQARGAIARGAAPQQTLLPQPPEPPEPPERPERPEALAILDDLPAELPPASGKPATPARGLAEIPPQTKSAPPEPVATLEDELGLLSSAQRAMREGLPERALLALAEHAWRFPNGQLAEAREVARISALCQAGKRALGRTERARFLTHRPESPFADRVRGLCP